MQRLSHENLSSELRFHGDERCTIKFLESAHQYNLNIFGINDVEVAHVVLGGEAIDKVLTVDSLE
jgi:hypothetical protein